MKTLIEASNKIPCEHCGKPDWCYSFSNGASVCCRGNIATGWIDSGKKDKNNNSILYPESWQGKPPEPRVISTEELVYSSREGMALVKVIRQNLDNGKKKIFQNYWNGHTWIKSRPKSISRSDIPIYKFGEISEAMEKGETIFICEGEKCVNKLWKIGLAATTNIQGAKNFSVSDVSDIGNYENVVLVPDRDLPGIALMKQWGKHLPQAVWLYPFPDKDWNDIPASEGLDIYDWISDRSLSKDDVLAWVGKIPESLKKIEVKTSTPLKDPQKWDDKDGKPTVETSTPLTEPRKESQFYYGGSKNLNSVELMDLVECLGDRLEFDEMASQPILDGKRLTIGKDIKFWFLKTFGEAARKDDIGDCLTYIARNHAFNPLRRYLESITTEPIPINNLAERYFGRSEPIYNRLVEMWLISAVARALTPLDDDNHQGTQVDHTLILQSSQGKYKSTFFKVLGGRWFSDSVKDIDSKDSLMIVHSNWIIELSELDRITSKKQAGSIKHWLTQRTDSFRKPYAPEIEPNLPRRCVFCGTVNPSRFLVDDENRRFWIIPISEDLAAIDIPLLETERDGIWKAAWTAYKQGQQWWPTDEEKAAIALLNQDFRQVDAWEDEINNWISDREFISSYEILTELLEFQPANIKQADYTRITRILQNLGWTKEMRKRYYGTDGKQIYRTVRLNPNNVINIARSGGSSRSIQSEQGFQKNDTRSESRSGGSVVNGWTGERAKVETLANSGQENFSWQEKNGHKLSVGMWVCLSNRDVVRLTAPAPIKGCWAADKEGSEIQIAESQISLVWEV